MRKYKKIISFILTSGIGWIIDFTIFCTLIYYYNFEIWKANLCSAIPAVTFVFLVSRGKIFRGNESSIDIRYKYLLYILYQVLLITFISFLANEIKELIIGYITVVEYYLDIFIKMVITIFTLTLNFIIMKVLIEKI